MRWLVPASPTKNSFKGQVSHHLERNWLRSYEVEWFMINLQALRLCGHNQVVYLPEESWCCGCCSGRLKVVERLFASATSIM